jgi:uncharacterized protein YukE
MIRVKNLDEAHAQTAKLFDTENKDGVELLNQLDKLIAGLKEHWIGEDGTNHINRLIEIHDKMQKYILGTLECTKLAMVSVVNLQEVRRANGGGGQVGDVRQSNGDFVKNIARVETTTEYYIDPAIREDYKVLEDVEERLKAFDSTVKAQKDELMENWVSGSNREDVQGTFDEIESLGAEAERVVAEVKQELGTSISNAEQVME